MNKLNLLADATISSSANSPNSYHRSIVTLPDCHLKESESSVLDKGLSFCPIKKVDKIQFFGNIEECFRRLRLKEFIHKKQLWKYGPQVSL